MWKAMRARGRVSMWKERGEDAEFLAGLRTRGLEGVLELVLELTAFMRSIARFEYEYRHSG